MGLRGTVCLTVAALVAQALLGLVEHWRKAIEQQNLLIRQNVTVLLKAHLLLLLGLLLLVKPVPELDVTPCLLDDALVLGSA